MRRIRDRSHLMIRKCLASSHLRPRSDQLDFEAPHFTPFLLLDSNCFLDLAADQVLVLNKVLDLLSACVHVTSSNARLSTLGAMDFSARFEYDALAILV